MSERVIRPVLFAFVLVLAAGAGDLARADGLGPWSLSLRAGPTWTKTDGLNDARAVLAPRLTLWRGISERAALGVDFEALSVRRDAAFVGPAEVNWYRAGAAWRRTSAPGSFEGFTTLGVGVYLERHRKQGSQVFPAYGITPAPFEETVDDVAFGPAMGVGLRFGTGSLKGALETRGSWAIGTGSWIQLQAGLDFD